MECWLSTVLHADRWLWDTGKLIPYPFSDFLLHRVLDFEVINSLFGRFWPVKSTSQILIWNYKASKSSVLHQTVHYYSWDINETFFLLPWNDCASFPKPISDQIGLKILPKTTMYHVKIAELHSSYIDNNLKVPLCSASHLSASTALFSQRVDRG